MKIRFWRPSNFWPMQHFFFLFAMVVNAIRGEGIFDTFFISSVSIYLLICAALFLPNYFSYLLQIKQEKLHLKDAVFQKATEVPLDIIQSIEIDTLGNEPMYIKFNLSDVEPVSFLTRDRTTEVYDRLIEHFPAWVK